MRQHHSPEIHKSLLERIPHVTGRTLQHWFSCLENGPALLRFEERVSWLRDNHGLPHGYATAIVHELDLRRGALRV